MKLQWYSPIRWDCTIIPEETELIIEMKKAILPNLWFSPSSVETTSKNHLVFPAKDFPKSSDGKTNY